VVVVELTSYGNDKGSLGVRPNEEETSVCVGGKNGREGRRSRRSRSTTEHDSCDRANKNDDKNGEGYDRQEERGDIKR